MRNVNNVKDSYVLREAVIKNGGKLPIVPDAMKVLKGCDKNYIYIVVSQLRSGYRGLETIYGKELWSIIDGVIYGLESAIPAETRKALNARNIKRSIGHVRSSDIDCSIYADRLKDDKVIKRNKEHKKVAGQFEGISYKYINTVDEIDEKIT